ncbi:energy transducer TonB [Roseateles oligotrophus]|uniref:Energy transducer TonB n=1 Tax=Roseateles oligotrophus TaxID=1769250 RepID=A0ABT2YIG9_9BURK|nr:energy transducer TonB [Roseateles oligotrophus]MCV2369803.1 energy transducer TonB [Roseateles oligotrophus]
MSRRFACALPGLVVSLMGVFGTVNAAFAQAETPLKSELSAEERAQKQADKVFTFIKLQSVKPAAKRAAAEPVAPSPPVQTASIAVAKVAPKPQAKVAAAAEPRQLASAAALASPSLDAQRSQESQPALLASASLTAATAQPELLPQRPAPQAEPEPPALQLLTKVEPEIPRQLQADFKGGAVTVRFMVQTDGSVGQAQAVQASHKRLAMAAVTAVNQWRFAPLPAPREASVDIAFAVE